MKRNTIIGITDRLILQYRPIIEINGLILIKAMCYQIKENKHADQVAPDIHRFIVKHEETFEQFIVSVEVYTVTSFDMFVVIKE